MERWFDRGRPSAGRRRLLANTERADLIARQPGEGHVASSSCTLTLPCSRATPEFSRGVEGGSETSHISLAETKDDMKRIDTHPCRTTDCSV